MELEDTTKLASLIAASRELKVKYKCETGTIISPMKSISSLDGRIAAYESIHGKIANIHDVGAFKGWVEDYLMKVDGK